MSGKELFPNLFKPGIINGFETLNRIKYAACSISNYNSPKGFILDREIYRCEAIGKTGAGILTNQGAYPDVKGEGKSYWRQVALYDERFLSGFRKIADMWRKDSPGVPIIQQIMHGGRYGGFDLDYSLMPSDVPQKTPHFGHPAKVMSIGDIERVIEEHVRSARLAIQAGFDGVEITSFQGYLIANFNSRYTNKRTDRYGGTLENRARFMVELLQGLRAAIGSHLILGARLNASELLGSDGNSDEECLEMAKIAQDAGLDYISITIGWHESPQGALGRVYKANQWLPSIENWKKALRVPLIFGVGCYDPFVAEKAISEGLIDYWELCRPMLADPERLHKILRNDLNAVRPCIGCLMCLAKGWLDQPYVCTVNPELGHEEEDEYKPFPAKRKKNVMIIGAGPAGIQTALAAVKKGHKVSLYDSGEKIGGQLLCCAKEPRGGERYRMLIDYFEEQISRSNIEVHLGVRMDQNLIYQTHAEVIVLATGSKFERPAVEGIDDEHVYDVIDVMANGVIPPGDKAVVFHGGKVGIVVALYLAAKGKQVTVVHQGKSVYEKVISTYRWRYRSWLKEYDVDTLTWSRLKAVKSGSVRIINDASTESQIEADFVVLAKRTANQDLFDYIELNSDEFHVIGDAIRPGFQVTAIHGGHRLGCRI